MRALLLALTLLLSSLLFLLLAATAQARTRKPSQPLPGLAALIGLYRQQPAPHTLTARGLRFACYSFIARDGILTACYLTGRTKTPVKHKPTPLGA